MPSILDNVKEQLLKVDFSKIEYSEGSITYYADGVATASGLLGAGFSEIVKIYSYDESSYILGLVFNLDHHNTGIICLEENQDIKVGSRVVTTGEVYSIEVSGSLLGRVVDVLGNPVDGLGGVHHKDSRKMPVDRKAYGVIDRKSVTEPLQTGMIAIDGLIPIGRGQRELIIGDRQTGKTTVAIDTIINQGKINQKIDSGEKKGRKVYSVYVSIGQKRARLANIVTRLKELDVLKYTVVISASASENSAVQYLAPFAGSSVGEFFMEKGEDALVVYDDLSKHAKAYRQISLLTRRPPGREAYPGDIFYLHSRLLERAAQLSDEMGGGSLTALPVIETLAGDVTTYIPTNVISITDGQIYLKSELFNSGSKPAIDAGNSVSRVGGAAQVKAIKQVAGQLRLKLAQFRSLQAFAQFGVEVDATTQKRIDEGLRLTEILKQGISQGLPMEEQVVSVWAVTNGYTDEVKLSKMLEWRDYYLEFMRDFHFDLLQKIVSEKKVTDEIIAGLKEVTRQFMDGFL